ncbi:putative RNA-directed DNA polymerase [Tanacetum coccineum]
MDLLRGENFSLCGLLETKVKKRKLLRVCSKVLSGWEWMSNAMACEGGTGIIIGWDPFAVRVMLHSQSSQLMNAFIETVNGSHKFFCSFVYAHVNCNGRKELWKDLIKHSLAVKDSLWVLMGDFNIILEPCERSMGSSSITAGMEDFRKCLFKAEISNIMMSGLQFTWNKSPGNPHGLLKKLDRVMGNVGFLEKYPNANAHFMPFVVSDHTLAVLNIPSMPGAKPKSFKFANFIVSKAEFLPTVKNVWDSNEFSMFSVTSKLKMLKKHLRKLKYVQGDLAANSMKLKEDPSALNAYKIASNDEELFLKQRAKVTWLSEGDFNTKYFHNVMKERRNRNRINNVEDLECNFFSGPKVGLQFVNHFEKVLGRRDEVDLIMDPDHLFVNKISPLDVECLVRPISDAEIKSALFSMEDDKAPGPDGFSSKIFKSSWSIVGTEFTRAIYDFFVNGKLLKEVNATIIALVPKVKTPKKVSDFKPISCCNISDNIMLTQELMRNHHRKGGPSKVAFKIDIDKAYDTVDWGFLRQCLVHFGFPLRMGMRGLRQGDPLSPYLFTIVMEVLSLMINRKIDECDEFKFHWRCSKVKLTHLCFANDLMIFSNGDVGSVSVIKAALNEFSRVSGLVPNMGKSQVFFGNVHVHIRYAILNVLPFHVGSLPIRYLGVPLISSRLYKKHCDPLIDKVKSRLHNWKNKSLSFAGRLQLIKFVVSSIQVFWSFVFILLAYVSQVIDKLMRGFIWSQGELQKGKAKVKWDDACGLKTQGGLGIKSVHYWNVALMSKHVWNLVSKKDSLWVKWINAYRLSDRRLGVRSFWDIPVINDVCWGWKKILQSRSVLRNHIVTRLDNVISKRDIYDAGLSLNCKVAELVWNGVWKWPAMLTDKFAFLSHLPPPLLFHDRKDKVFWKSNAGKIIDLSIKAVWNDLIPVKPSVPCLMNLDLVPDDLYQAIDYLLARPMRNSIWSIIQRLVIGGVVYFIWQERNLRVINLNAHLLPDESLMEFCVLKSSNGWNIDRINGMSFWYSCKSGVFGLKMADISCNDKVILELRMLELMPGLCDGNMIYSISCSSLYLYSVGTYFVISFLNLFPKHVLGMTYDSTYMGLSI